MAGVTWRSPSLLCGVQPQRGDNYDRMVINVKHLGTVRSFDETKGRGLIKPDSGADYLIFERSGIYQNRQVRPIEGQRLTYQLGMIDGQRCAVNLGNV